MRPCVCLFVRPVVDLVSVKADGLFDDIAETERMSAGGRRREAVICKPWRRHYHGYASSAAAALQLPRDEEEEEDLGPYKTPSS